jgi:hypothetical protein
MVVNMGKNKKQDSTRIASEIGVDPNPTEPGSYNVEVENIMFCMAEYFHFDGGKWDIPTEFQGRRIWWYNVRYEDS